MPASIEGGSVDRLNSMFMIIVTMIIIMICQIIIYFWPLGEESLALVGNFAPAIRSISVVTIVIANGWGRPK